MADPQPVTKRFGSTVNESDHEDEGDNGDSRNLVDILDAGIAEMMKIDAAVFLGRDSTTS